MISAPLPKLSGKPCDGSDDENRLWADFNKKMAATNIPDDKKEYLMEKASSVLIEVFCPAYIEFAEVFEAIDYNKRAIQYTKLNIAVNKIKYLY